MANRNEQRKQRYDTLIKLGFSSKEATRFRDLSQTNIQKLIVQREENLKKTKTKTGLQNRQLERIESQRPRFTTNLTGTRNARLDNFRRWSKSRRFPKEADTFIHKANSEAGYDILDSYGYRLFYHMYVNRLPEAEAIRRMESNDT